MRYRSNISKSIGLMSMTDYPPYDNALQRPQWHINSYHDKDGDFIRTGNPDVYRWFHNGVDMGLYNAGMVDRNVPGFWDKVDDFVRNIFREGHSNKYEEEKRNFVGEGVTVLSDLKFNSNGTVGTGAGHARALIFTDDFYTVADAGGIVGDAANAMSLTRFIINMGYSASTGDDAVSRLREKDYPIRFPTDSSKNTQMGGGWYNTMDQYGDFLELKKDSNYLKDEKTNR